MICMGLFHWNTPVKHTHDLHGAFSLKHTSTTHAWVLFTEINDGTTHTVMMTCMRTERSGRTHSLSRGVAIETGAVLCYQVVFIFPETQKQDHLLSGWYHYCLLSVTHNFHSHWLIQLPHSHWLIQLPHSHWLIQLPHSHWLIQLPHSHWLIQLPHSPVTGLYNFHTVTGLYSFHTVTGLYNFHIVTG